MCPCVLQNMRNYTGKYTPAYTHKPAHMNTHMCTYTCTHAPTRTQAHAHARAHTCTYTPTPAPTPILTHTYTRTALWLAMEALGLASTGASLYAFTNDSRAGSGGMLSMVKPVCQNGCTISSCTQTDRSGVRRLEHVCAHPPCTLWFVRAV
jgi:hypothetical protein